MPEPHRAGAVALLGPPNAGKSTLLNAVLGEKLAIVSAKPQTTRSRILGIHSQADAQILFLDTPGRHESPKALNRALNETVESTLEDADAALLLVDLTRGWEPVHEALAEALREQRKPFLVVGTKHDRPEAGSAPWPPTSAAAEAAVATLRIAATRNEGLDGLLAALVPVLPESPPLYPEDTLTDRSTRWLVAELVREAAFETLAQELPYTLAVEVVSFDESRPERVHIRAHLIVVRNSQKRIVVGSGGQVIKAIGVAARAEIERLLDSRVHLELWVKVEPRWLKSPRRLHSLGYS